MATYSISGLVMMTGLGIRPLATSSQFGFTAASSYLRHTTVITRYARQLQHV